MAAARGVPAIAALSALTATTGQPALAAPTTGSDQPVLLLAQAVDCAAGRKLMLLEYWKFLNANPECAPSVDDDAFYEGLMSPATESLEGPAPASICIPVSRGDCRSGGYNSRSRADSGRI